MDIVLGVSMAPTSVRMLLVEGENADGVTVEDNQFSFAADDDAATLSAADQVISAILGTREGAAEAGHALTSTGVTWTDPLDAAALRDALATRKVENVMLVSSFMAAAALAQTVGCTIGDAHTALLFLEPDTATVAVIDSADGSITDVHKELMSGGHSIAELAGMVAGLAAAETRPQSVFIVGSGVDVAAIKPQLESVTALPVTAAEEPETALAWGAALASANAPLFASSTAALAYALDPGTGAIDPYAVSPGYLAAPEVPIGTTLGEDDLAYSAVPDEEADAHTVSQEVLSDEHIESEPERRRPRSGREYSRGHRRCRRTVAGSCSGTWDPAECRAAASTAAEPDHPGSGTRSDPGECRRAGSQPLGRSGGGAPARERVDPCPATRASGACTGADSGCAADPRSAANARRPAAGADRRPCSGRDPASGADPGARTDSCPRRSGTRPDSAGASTRPATADQRPGAAAGQRPGTAAGQRPGTAARATAESGACAHPAGAAIPWVAGTGHSGHPRLPLRRRDRPSIRPAITPVASVAATAPGALATTPADLVGVARWLWRQPRRLWRPWWLWRRPGWLWWRPQPRGLWRRPGWLRRRPRWLRRRPQRRLWWWRLWRWRFWRRRARRRWFQAAATTSPVARRATRYSRLRRVGRGA